jgi:tRNA A-37 threonylcarbamoyl transferase component Bud32
MRGGAAAGGDEVRVVAPDGLIADRYRLRGPLGSGASATVWAAVDETLGRQVALKVLSGPTAADESERDQLRREARALAALAHPHVIVVFDFLETPGLDGAVQPVLVTELLDGRSLAARLDEGPLPWQETLTLCGQLADALAAAHRTGITHRDVTPANVMLTGSGVKLLDFGIAQAGAQEGTVEGATVGTPVCMAPEQLTGQGALPASDMYAFGCVLHWCLTGRPPFRDKDIAWLSHAHLHAAPPPLEIAGLPQGINEFYLACLSKDPARRPTAEEAVQTLAPYGPAPAADRSRDANATQVLPMFGAGDPDDGATAAMGLGILGGGAGESGTTATGTAKTGAAGTGTGDGGAADNATGTPRARRHAGPSSGIDRRRLIPVGLLLAALAGIGLLMLALAHSITGSGASADQSTGSGPATATGTAGASPTSTVVSVALPSGSAAASSSTTPSASPSRTSSALSVSPLSGPGGDLLGYLRALSDQIQTLVAQGPDTLSASAGQNLRSSVADLQSAVSSAQQSGGRKQWRTVSNMISGIQRQISDDASTGQMSSAAANLLSGELQRLAGSLPVNGN